MSDISDDSVKLPIFSVYRTIIYKNIDFLPKVGEFSLYSRKLYIWNLSLIVTKIIYNNYMKIYKNIDIFIGGKGKLYIWKQFNIFDNSLRRGRLEGLFQFI